jgi:hypothetical protein
MPQTPYGLVHVERLSGGEAIRVHPDANAVVIISANPGELELNAARAWASCEVPVAVVGLSQEALQEGQNSQLIGVTYLAPTHAGGEVKALAHWLVEQVPTLVALAATFPCCRPQAASRLTRAAAASNAAVGAIDLIKGADFPVMLVTECKLAFDMAAVYAAPTSRTAVPELVLAAATGLLSRGLYRQAVRLIPAAPWLARGAVAGATTMGLGTAFKARHEFVHEVDTLWYEVCHRTQEAWREVSLAVSSRTTSLGPDVVYVAEDERASWWQRPEDVEDVRPAPERVDIAQKRAK